VKLMLAEIRASILDGDIDRAFKHTTAYYPHVLEDNPEIVFRLKCRRYVEMIRRCSELHNPIPSEHDNSNDFPIKSTTNGHTEVFGQDMELDDEHDDDDDDDDDSFQMTNTSNGDAQPEAEAEYHNILADPSKYDELLQEAMSYGQTLMREYRDEKREYRKTLEDIFSLIAYDDAKASVHGHLLETGGRVQVAEELNSAILGKSIRPIFPPPPSPKKLVKEVFRYMGSSFFTFADRVSVPSSLPWPILLRRTRTSLSAN
jgi:Ran-binding protein 9/10